MKKWLVQTKSNKSRSDVSSRGLDRADSYSDSKVTATLLTSRSTLQNKNTRGVEPDPDSEDRTQGRAMYSMKVTDVNMNQILTRLSKFTGDDEVEDPAERTYVDDKHGGRVNISRLKQNSESTEKVENKPIAKILEPTDELTKSVTSLNTAPTSSRPYRSSSLRTETGWRVVNNSPKSAGATLRRHSYTNDDRRALSYTVQNGTKNAESSQLPSRRRKLPSITEDKEDASAGDSVSNDDSGIEEACNTEEGSDQMCTDRDNQSSPEDDDVWITKEDGLVARFVNTLSEDELELSALEKPTPRASPKPNSGSVPEVAVASGISVVSERVSASFAPIKQRRDSDNEVTTSECILTVSEEDDRDSTHDYGASGGPLRETIPIERENAVGSEASTDFDVRHCVRRVRVSHLPSKMIAPHTQKLQAIRSNIRLPSAEEVHPTLPPVPYPGASSVDHSRAPSNDAVVSRSSPPGYKEFCIRLDVRHYGPDEVLVVLEEGVLVVSGERFSFSDYGCESCHFYRQYALPEGFTKFDISSKITESGNLVITGKKSERRDSVCPTLKRSAPSPDVHVAFPSGRRVSVENECFQELDERRYVLLVDCYGCAPSDIALKLEGRDLIVQTKPSLMYLQDTQGRTKTTVRKYSLPENASVDSITSRMMDGDVLKIEVLKIP